MTIENIVAAYLKKHPYYRLYRPVVSVREIVTEYLERFRYDGLHNEKEMCACSLKEDLILCQKLHCSTYICKCEPCDLTTDRD